MHRGYFRLGIVLTGFWLSIVVGAALYEFLTRNPFCQFDSISGADPICQHFFWSWLPSGKEAKFSPNFFRVLLIAIGPPAIGWVLGFSINWVRKGFRPDAT
jgi:hypothetical protein